MVVSRRVQKTQDGRSDLHTQSSGTLDPKVYQRSSKAMVLQIVLVVGMGIALCYFRLPSGVYFEGSTTPSVDGGGRGEQRIGYLHLSKAEMASAKQKYQNCTVSFTPPPPRSEANWRKPLWVPSYPASGSASPSKKGDIVKQLIDGITGLKQATKNYHMSMRRGKLKRCRGLSETAACSQGHPSVSVGPEKQTENFQPSVIFVIRNVATAFPAGHTDKHIAYHDGKGQPPEHQWRKVRNEYLAGSIQAWREMIRWWTASDYYKVILYIPFEFILSPTKGPPLVKQLAQLYQQAGFEVASSPEDISCIWYHAAQKEWHRQEQLAEYLPGYTKEQRDLLLAEFDAQIQEFSSDPELISLLKDYRSEVWENIKLDQPAIDEKN